MPSVHLSVYLPLDLIYKACNVALLLDQQAKWEIIKEEGSRLPAEVELFWCSSNA